jgi:hypothetical protein
VFFVSVASKGFRFHVRSLESTLMERLASVDSKGLREGRKWKSKTKRGGRSRVTGGKELADKRRRSLLRRVER